MNPCSKISGLPFDSGFATCLGITDLEVCIDGGAGVYVSYTQLNDDANKSICINSTHIGVRSTQVCADTGVYYLNVVNYVGKETPQPGPPGFDKLLQYGIMPWWPVSSAATAYRILNPNGNVVPPIMTTKNTSIFDDYVTNFVASHPQDALSAVGQFPGTWTMPVWYVILACLPLNVEIG